MNYKERLKNIVDLGRWFRGTPIFHDGFPKIRDEFDAALDDAQVYLDQPFPKIVTLCGSTRFFKEFQEANLRETLAGNIVLSIGCSLREDRQIWAGPVEREAIKKRLDELHFKKIEMSDEIFVINLGGYIGYSTGRELAHARKLGKAVRFLEPEREPLTQMDSDDMMVSGEPIEPIEPIPVHELGGECG